jgi:hypothetical protein
VCKEAPWSETPWTNPRAFNMRPTITGIETPAGTPAVVQTILGCKSQRNIFIRMAPLAISSFNKFASQCIQFSVCRRIARGRNCTDRFVPSLPTPSTLNATDVPLLASAFG